LAWSISLPTGSGLTGFALGVWVCQQTGSVTQFALIALFSTLPGIIFSPFAGALVDRWDRRIAMIVSDAGAALCTAIIALLLFTGGLKIWHLYLLLSISSTFSAFQWPAYSAATTLLVPKAQLGRASGMVQIAEAVAGIGSPVLAGVLMGLCRCTPLCLSISQPSFCLGHPEHYRAPRPEISAENLASPPCGVKRRMDGSTAACPGLLGLLLYFASTNFTSSTVQVLLTPGAQFFKPRHPGSIMTVERSYADRQPFDEHLGVQNDDYLASLVLLPQAIVLFAAGFSPNVVILSAAVSFSVHQPIDQWLQPGDLADKTAPDVEGRVFSFRRMIAWSSMPLAYISAGPLADKVFEPLMAVDGALAGSIGRYLGVGPGRGISLLFIILGTLSLLMTLIISLNARTRRVELELPMRFCHNLPQIKSLTFGLLPVVYRLPCWFCGKKINAWIIK
jgi:MFS family permease